MTDTSSSKRSLKQKAVHELREMVVLFLYLAFFFCALATYRMLLLREFDVKSLTFAFALINALVVAKVIMIGEIANVGKRYESKELFRSIIWKALLFSLLVLVFHFAEEVIKQLVHGKEIAEAFRETRIDDLLGRGLVIFCTFITLFGFREFSRVLGEEKFQAMLFGSGKAGSVNPHASERADESVPRNE
jgi:hypothetical protein